MLRQHQFHELCRQRGWTYKLQGRFDSHNTPLLELGDPDYRAELWVEPIEDVEGAQSGEAIYLYVATDQVRLHRGSVREPLDLDHEVVVGADSVVSLVKLVPLVGG